MLDRSTLSLTRGQETDAGQSPMLLMDSPRHAGCSPVCLDLSVGLLPSSPETTATGCSNRTLSDEQANKTLEARLTQVSEENRRLTEMIAYLYASQVARQQSPDADGHHHSHHGGGGRKRSRDSLEPPPSNSSDGGGDAKAKAEPEQHGAVESALTDEGTCRRIKVARVCTRIDPSDPTSLAVKDGYHWRKYGQKVTRDNPSPRAYFRCAYAPSCPVKKKVQRSAEDSSVLVATYEGEHNHPSPARAGELLPSSATAGGPVPCSVSINSSGPTITLDLTKNREGGVLEAAEAPPDLNRLCREMASPDFRAALVEQMARSLTKDSNFTDALAAAILRQLPEY